MTDHTKSPATQPYRTTASAQQMARQLPADWRTPPPTSTQLVTLWPFGQLVRTTYADGPTTYTAPYRCPSCHTPHATQIEADACCPANEISTEEALGLVVGNFIGRITDPNS